MALQSSKDLSVAKDVTETVNEVLSGKTTTNWFCAEFKKGRPPKLSFYSKGTKGIGELKNVLKDAPSKALFAMLRVSYVDINDKVYNKFLYVRFVGSVVPVMVKGHLTPQIGSCDAVFKDCDGCLQYNLDEDFDGFNQNLITRQILKEYPLYIEIRHFDYGDGEAFNYKQSNVKATNKQSDIIKVVAQQKEASKEENKNENDD